MDAPGNDHGDSRMRHLTDNELAGFLDGDLSDADRTRIGAHLGTCDACRAEAVEVTRLLQGAPASGSAPPLARRARAQGRAAPAGRPRWRAPAGLAGLAAAAGLAVLLLWPAASGMNEAPMAERFRTEGVARLEIHTPAPDAVVRREEVRFSWARHGAASYRITLTAADGGLVWSTTLADTVAVPPAVLELPVGQTLFWYVDAIDVGVVARTGAHPFSIAP
jgi:anti-sigma factor RsiW